MNNLTMAMRSLTKKKLSSFIKILSLGTGLAVGLILVAKVFFVVTYEDFYPDVKNIYNIESLYSSTSDPTSDPYHDYRTSGAIAPGLKSEAPQVEKATRFTGMDGNTFITEDKQRLRGRVILADNCFYDVLPRPMVVGNAKDVLSRPMYAMISSEIAGKMNGNPIGQIIELDNYPGKKITIGGIFEKLPENTNFKYDVVMSLSSIRAFMGDGSNNWVGNERYISFVKLRPGTNPASLKVRIDNMVKRNLPTEELLKQGRIISFSLVPIRDIHTKSAEARRMILILSLLAISIISIAVFNYILIVISTLVSRSREMAVYKCYGAGNKNIVALIFTEAALNLFLSLIFALALILTFRGTVQELMGESLGALFSFRSCALLLILCGFILLVAGFFPARMFMRIPISSAFRNYRTSGRNWKLILLFVQFIAASFLIILLVIVGRQYNTMLNDDPGYKYENVLYFGTPGISPQDREVILDKLKRLPGVETVSMGESLLFDLPSGNNVSLPGDDNVLFNLSDFYQVDENYLEIFDIPVIDGKKFTLESIAPTDAMVSRSFAERMRENAGWEDGVVGKQVKITDHDGITNIVGVYENFRVGAIGYEDTRPSIMYFSNTDSPTSMVVLVKLHQMARENIVRVNEIIEAAMPDKDLNALVYSDSMVKMYDDSRLFRNSVMLGSIVALIIVLIGLVGYVNNEINRRGAEIAVRKVNGATAANILKLFSSGILKIALPALIIGALGAYFVAQKWMENFSVKTSLSPVIFIICLLIVLTIILGVVTLTSFRIANQNPVKSLKNE